MNRSIFVPDTFSQRQFWKDVLKQWLQLLKRYECWEDDNPDVAYWHGERPLTGLLGAAAWMLQDGWSLEEFSTKRKSESRKGKGRGDLWFGRGKAEATVEAKIYWVGERIPTATKYLRAKLDEAASQLQSVSRKNRVGDPVSACDVVPLYDVPTGRKRGIKTIAELVAWAHNESLATAKHITPSNANTVSESGEYPGVLLVARQEKWCK